MRYNRIMNGGLNSRLQDNIVITFIPAGTSAADRQAEIEVGRKLAKGASSKGRRYKTNWAEYHKKKRLANQQALGL